VQYFRSLPLHSSQEEIETKRGYSIFSYYLAPDYDFKQDILSFGDSVEVLEPKTFREAIKETINQLNTYYNNEQ
jgi:predicted DNA-binding transcriptional regulator YafY